MTDYNNPRYVNALGGIQLDVSNNPTASIYVDEGPVYDRAIAGEFGDIAAYVSEPDADPDPFAAFPPLEPWQFTAMLDIAGLTDTVNAAIDAMTDATTKAIVKAKLAKSPVYLRSDPLFDQIGALIGKTSAEINTLWMQAVALS